MISKMIKLQTGYKGETLFSVILAITIFAGIFLAINQWQSQQRKTANQIYQRVQATQIAENQKQRIFLAMPCEKSVRQNQLQFQISCQQQQVRVRYQGGEINL